jgi:hypothetical protein
MQVIRRSFKEFQATLRTDRHDFIEAALDRVDSGRLTAQEKETIDRAAATGCLPFDDPVDANSAGGPVA